MLRCSKTESVCERQGCYVFARQRSAAQHAVDCRLWVYCFWINLLDRQAAIASAEERWGSDYLFVLEALL
jgi:hypothetical protein